MAAQCAPLRVIIDIINGYQGSKTKYLSRLEHKILRSSKLSQNTLTIDNKKFVFYTIYFDTKSGLNLVICRYL